MRVFELAKQLNVPSKDLISDLKTIGVTVSNHMAALETEVVAQIVKKVEKKDAPKSPAASAVKKKVLASRPPVAVKVPSVPAEPPKGEKKLILVKRRHNEPLLGPDLLPLKSEEELLPVEELTERTAIPSAPELIPQASPQAPEPTPTPFLPPGQLPPAHPSERPTWAKKGGPEVVPPLPDQSLKDKGKKTRRAVRDREDEPLPLRDDAARWRDLRAMPMHRREEKSRHATPGVTTEVTKPRLKAVKLAEGLTVKDFAEAVGQKPADVIKKLMEMDMVVALNQPIASEAASLLAESFGVRIEMTAERPTEELLVEEAAEVETPPAARPPVVTIMGHVDHGKTSLLDAIRETKVTEGEAGGITQHIGAYVVATRGQLITFLDTPGHEAFTAMRARGAKVTDIVVLVVAADDGVMPQTIEAVDHARAAEVPIIVAINKIDKPDANPDRIKNQLSERGLVSEAWGGETIFVEVSAKKKTGLDTLLEMILLQAEVLELRAAPERLARGIVLEAKIDRGRGPVATVLVQNGTLRSGDPFVVGTYSGRVRALFNHAGRPIKDAGPSIPVEVVGMLGVPMAGQEFVVTKDERIAREIAESRLHKLRTAEMAPVRKVTLDDLFSQVKEGTVKELGIIIRADVQGSAEALADAIERLSAEAVKPNIVLKGVGGITENDVQLASASNAVIIGFNVRAEAKAAALAEREGIDIRSYSIIYEALNDIRSAMEGLLDPTFKERVVGRAEVRKVFMIPKAGAVAGCYVTDGAITRASAGIRVVRDGVVVYEGKISSLRRFKDDVKEVQAGYECGISVENFNDVKAGDRFEVYALDKVLGKL
ncbi:MAG: translation initiation factor IF-2 [Nitrospirota bacterium]